IVPFIDWSPFFHTWELRGRYPKIFEDPTVGAKAKELFDDAQSLLKDMVGHKLLTARGVYGFFPANSVGDDIEVYRDESRSKVLAMFHTLRQQTPKPEGQFNEALADAIAPEAPGYPACPDHTEKRILFDLLQAEKNTGITLTETFAMLPASSVSGLYFAHPEAKYFAVGKLGRDQILDYARRKNMDLVAIERWLSPNLNYDPAGSPTATPG